jgi:hypothetical protein
MTRDMAKNVRCVGGWMVRAFGSTIAGLMIGALCLSGKAAAAQPAAAPSNSPAVAEPFPAWDHFAEELRGLWPKMAAKLPARLRNNPQIQEETGRLMLEALAEQTIDAISADGDHPVFLPNINLTLNVFQPNADTVYRTATITQGGVYRLRGEVGSLRIFKMAQFPPTPADTGAGVHALVYDDFSTLHADQQGRFDVIVSPTRPAGYTGDWWQLYPEATSFMIRQVASDWSKERDPTISIERLDKPVERSRPAAADLERRLRRLPERVANAAGFLFDHVEGLRREGYINKLKIFDVVSNLGGLFGQFYYEGAYELRPDEALIVEAKVPEKCSYASFILTDDIYETTDWYNNQSSLNDSQWRVDRDGILRIVVSPGDPGVPNWIDTAGYPTGAMQGRWTDCSATPVPSVRKVALADVRRSLPPDTPTITPAQRERIVRDRRSKYQQRPLW